MGERRQAQRIGTKLDIYYKNKNKTIEGLAFTKNISRSGILFEANKDLRPGMLLNLEVNLPGQITPIFGQAKTIWVRAARAGSAEVGVNIEKMDWYDRSRILEYLYSEWLKEISPDIQEMVHNYPEEFRKLRGL